ncbi:oxidoreductase [Flavobacterium qiangtangense]|uniref:Oxidoreductase n=1 Tax=Flavobacterium qiangtangense TaxID=1442595 RepID=A0ABW1PJX6_9FLAO
MIVAIAGATGLTGSYCLDFLLLQIKITKVIAIGRKSTGIKNPKLEEVILIDNQLTSKVVADAFICCLGTTIKKAGSKEAFKEVDFELPVYLAKNLYENGCKISAVISAMGADENSVFFYNQVKGKMEIAMQNIGFESLSIFRPSIIDGKRKEKRFGEKVGLAIIKIISPLFVGSLKNYRPIHAKIIGRAIMAVTLIKKPGITIYLSDEIKKI